MPHTLFPPAEVDARPPRAAAASVLDSEAYFRSLVEDARDVIHVIDPDRTTRYITPSVRRLLGYEPEELIGSSILEILHPDDVEDALALLRRQRADPARGLPLEIRVRHRDGSWRIFEGVARNLVDDPVVRGVVVNSRDVTERRRRDEQIRRLASIPLESPNPILECGADGCVAYANPAAERLVAELALDGARGLLPADHDDIVRACLAGGAGTRRHESAAGGRVFQWTYHGHPAVGSVHLFGEEVTERKRIEERMLQHALHDPLTGLPNRLLFMERLGQALIRFHRREGGEFAVLFLDLDRFKVVNDSLGHHVGDELLRLVADRLRASVRQGDTVARFGGDEFAVLLEELESLDDATRVAERLGAEVAAPINLGGYEVFTSASIGIALCATGLDRPEYLLRNADMAMYRAKGAGNSRYEVFDRGMHAQALARLQTETDLRRALLREEFRLFYQPIVDLRRGTVTGVEALLRWDHPERGLVLPGDFIGLAEETGVILPLGEWVLRESCRQLGAWRREFPHAHVAVSVNLSARQFGQRDLVEQVRGAIAAAQLEPRHLKLEITESALVDNAGSAGVMLRQLRDLGVQVQMDDFGTGYSSLSSLHALPLDALKVDRSFVSRIPAHPATTQLVRTIATLARGLDLAVIAEGVETEAQLSVVEEMGCDYAQGFLFSPPLPPDEMRGLLAEERRW